MIEGNFDVSFDATGKVIISVPHDYVDTLHAFRDRLAARRVHQAYVKLGYPRKPRTTGDKSQSHHFNGHVQQIANHTGNTFDDEKMHLKREAISMGYPFHTTSYGEVVPESEANASTVECGYLIDTAHRIASDLGIRLKEE
jgi:hypothetical protein